MCQVCNRPRATSYGICPNCLWVVYPRTAASILGNLRLRFEYDYTAGTDSF